MVELTVTYTDENSDRRTVIVAGETFVIGRHSQCDLSVPDSRLSRRHLKIARFADVFVASDLGSSNGSKLNGVPLDEPQTIADGDVLDLGGVEFIVGEESEDGASAGEDADKDDEEDASAGSVSAAAAPAPEKKSIFGNVLIIGPLMVVGILVLVVFGAVIYSLVSGGGDEKRTVSNFPTPLGDDYDFSTPEPSVEPSSPTGPTPVATASEGGDVIPPPDTPSTDNGNVDEEEKLRRLVTSFMRAIAVRDPNPVITSEPLSLIKSKISQYRGSTTLAANFEDAARSSSQIVALANSKNMRPEFIAAAALAKLGNSRGSVAATAGTMIGPLSELRIQIGDGFANECLVIVAAYDQGLAGNTLAMRDTMMKLSTDNPDISSRKVRTIWFLRDKGKLSEAQFEFALRFLAIGTIAQDPKSFGVNASPLKLS